ncbi:MAG TPA: nuclear transport factor 2 family protein [Acidobacteriaceae bacterium]|nr:nuclear transport factor 2 family protein [Acidobacteriaceae bacterium]
MDYAEQLRKLEEHLLDPRVRKNAEEVSSLLADDFLEIGSSGRTYNKARMIEELRSEPVRPASALSDFEVHPLTPEMILVHYRSTRKDAAGQSAGQALRTSIWVLRNGRWVVRFHQGTTIP